MKKRRILVAALNWGLGHATRMIPVIEELLRQGVEVLIASDGRALRLLQNAYPQLTHIPLKGYHIRYQRHGSLVWQMLKQLPQLLYNIYHEHQYLYQIIKDHQIEGIISDSRFGLWSKDLPCVIVSHQLFIRLPKTYRFGEKAIFRFNHWIIDQYDVCWVPDWKEEPTLSGELAHLTELNREKYRFVGPLSRIKKEKSPAAIPTDDNYADDRYDIAIILSGPEPQRSMLEEKLLEKMENRVEKILLVRGITESNHIRRMGKNIKMIDHLQAFEIQKVLNSSQLIICRSGYSSIMDLVMVGKPAILIPTPQQTEQEYLAAYFKNKGIYYSCSQATFDLDQALSESEKFTGWKDLNEMAVPFASGIVLENEVKQFLDRIDF